MNYQELYCKLCKIFFMLPNKVMENDQLVKKCPVCQGKKFVKTGRLGMAVSKQQVEQAAAAMKGADDTETLSERES